MNEVKDVKKIKFYISDDVELLKMVLSENPFLHEKKWELILNNMRSNIPKPFTLRNVKERVNFMIKSFKKEERVIRRKSGTEEEYQEKDHLLEEAARLQDEFKKKTGRGNTAKGRAEEGKHVRDAAAAVAAAEMDNNCGTVYIEDGRQGPDVFNQNNNCGTVYTEDGRQGPDVFNQNNNCGTVYTEDGRQGPDVFNQNNNCGTVYTEDGQQGPDVFNQNNNCGTVYTEDGRQGPDVFNQNNNCGTVYTEDGRQGPDLFNQKTPLTPFLQMNKRKRGNPGIRGQITSFLKQQSDEERELKRRALDIEERKLAVEERRLCLQEQAHNFQVEVQRSQMEVIVKSMQERDATIVALVDMVKGLISNKPS